MLADTVDNIYHVLGADGIARLTTAFYRLVSTDDLLRPMYPEADLHGAETRLRDFLIFRFGGPPHYIQQRGHPRLRLRHGPFAIDQQARDRWISLMEQALQEAALPVATHAPLRAFFQEVATFLINRPTS